MKKIVLLLALMLPATVWAGTWKLDGAASEINFVSVKKGSVAEVHHFSGLSGVINDHQASVTIALATIESGIGIRNQRMQSMLFEVERFASATITAELANTNYASLKPGESVSLTLPFTLDLHGLTKEFSAQVRVVALADGKLLISALRPVIVRAADFQLDAGIETLRQIAKLPSIAHSVPVTFELLFEPD